MDRRVKRDETNGILDLIPLRQEHFVSPKLHLPYNYSLLGHKAIRTEGEDIGNGLTASWRRDSRSLSENVSRGVSSMTHSLFAVTDSQSK